MYFYQLFFKWNCEDNIRILTILKILDHAHISYQHTLIRFFMLNWTLENMWFLGLIAKQQECFCTSVFLLSQRDAHSLFKYGFFSVSKKMFVFTEILPYIPWHSFFNLTVTHVQIKIEVTFMTLMLSGVPIIDYINWKSVDYQHNPSARLQNFHSD
jgi:hypothetical protein